MAGLSAMKLRIEKGGSSLQRASSEMSVIREERSWNSDYFHNADISLLISDR
jgi:hypothetical protein